jgi:hypothetical protein
MPSLLCLAGEPKLDRKAIGQIGKLVDEALESAEAAGYRIDRLLGTAAEAEAAEPEKSPIEPDAGESSTAEPNDEEARPENRLP